MHKWQKDTKLVLPQCLVFLKLYCILRMTQPCPDQGCIYIGFNKSNFLTFSKAEVSFTLCDPHYPLSVSSHNQQWFVQVGAQELPNKVLPVLACGSPDHREKGSTMEAPSTQTLSAVNTIQSKHHWQPRAPIVANHYNLL